ncbi:hypothetical protein EYF80_030926 [Liparis tanakae]|uniref:Uncharacterized protein n=1 Tax=Liparis tanakae TaxID=230148 RepID=A0A4Z2H193_9TELE|nr:hypothetical protein EYF80_030926 [Liparis tanakae]
MFPPDRASRMSLPYLPGVCRSEYSLCFDWSMGNRLLARLRSILARLWVGATRTSRSVSGVNRLSTVEPKMMVRTAGTVRKNTGLSLFLPLLLTLPDHTSPSLFSSLLHFLLTLILLACDRLPLSILTVLDRTSAPLLFLLHNLLGTPRLCLLPRFILLGASSSCSLSSPLWEPAGTLATVTLAAGVGSGATGTCMPLITTPDTTTAPPSTGNMAPL